MGAWIETKHTYCNKAYRQVAPYVGAWIETLHRMCHKKILKVAPYVGAWIETYDEVILSKDERVAPYVGAWIETIMGNAQSPARESHPMWVRGLKLLINVAVLMPFRSRTLCGCVD